MPYFLFSTSRQSRISEVFGTEREIWLHVRAQGLFSEVIDREDLEPRRILIRTMKFISAMRGAAASEIRPFGNDPGPVRFGLFGLLLRSSRPALPSGP